MKPQISFLIPGLINVTFLKAFGGLKYQTVRSWKSKWEQRSKEIFTSRRKVTPKLYKEQTANRQLLIRIPILRLTF